MRCKACNKLLSDAEARRKDKETKEFLDLCGECFYASEEALTSFYYTDTMVVEEEDHTEH